MVDSGRNNDENRDHGDGCPPLPPDAAGLVFRFRIPGLSCTEEDGSTSSEPRWDCDGTQIRAKEVGVQDKDQATRRYLRAMGEGTAMPEGDIDRDGDKRTLSDGDLVAISIEGDGPTTFLSLHGPRAEELAQEVEKA